MNQIVLVKDATGTWREPSITAYENEKELQQLVARSPNLLTGDAMATVDEFWISGIGSVDIVGVGGDGSITVVECKLKANPEIRREVVGQLLAYAGGLWQMNYETFAATWAARSGSSLIEDVRCRANPDADADELRSQVSENLSAGSFTLVIAVDAITEELKRIIEYANEVTRDEVRVIGLELQLAKEGRTEILVPRTYGGSLAEAKAAASAGKAKWTADSFAAAVDALPEPDRAIIGALMDHGSAHGHHPWWGVGQVPGMSWYYAVGDQVLSMFQIYLRPAGVAVAASIGGLNGAAKDGPALARRMLDGLRAIPSISEYLAQVSDDSMNRYPSIPITGALDQPGAVDAFIGVIDDVRAAAAAAPPNHP